jgi:hypothetical protein
MMQRLRLIPMNFDHGPEPTNPFPDFLDVRIHNQLTFLAPGEIDHCWIEGSQ